MMKRNVFFFICLSIGAIAFSSWLMFQTFSYDSVRSVMLIGVKAWSDFGAHIPLIRSFSLGNNWPPEYPLFPGSPIRYHFLFYFLVGMLEKNGLRIDWALNIPSIIGFAGLMIGIAIFAQKLFHDKRITLLSVIFFLFNGSLSFLRFFQTHPLSKSTFHDIVTNNTFPSFAPWGPGDVTAFWNLNIYTNQRHLAFAFALAMLSIGILVWIEKKPLKQQIIFLIPEICIIAVMPYFHQPILLILAIFLACYFIIFPKLRVLLLLIGSISSIYMLPQIQPILSGPKTFAWHPGFLLASPFTPMRIIWYWFQNIGLHLVFIPLGWLLAPKRVKKILFPLWIIFLVPNLFQFAIEMAANHKFFNFYLIFGNMLSAFVLIKIIDFSKKIPVVVRQFVTLLVCVSVVILTFSGIIDFFPVANDTKIPLEDIPQNTIATWIQRNTPPDAVFLNSSWFFQPASIAGRKIFMGWPYFAWSAGYNTYGRMDDMKTLYETTDTRVFCSLIQKNHISYITYQEPSELTEIQFSVDALARHAKQVYTTNTYSIWIPLCRY